MSKTWVAFVYTVDNPSRNGMNQFSCKGLLRYTLRLSLLYETLSGAVFNSWSWWIQGSNSRNKTIIMLINGGPRMAIWINVLIVTSIRGNCEYDQHPHQSLTKCSRLFWTLSILFSIRHSHFSKTIPSFSLCGCSLYWLIKLCHVSLFNSTELNVLLMNWIHTLII